MPMVKLRWFHGVVLLALLLAASVATWTLYERYRNWQALHAILSELEQSEPTGWRLADLERQRREVPDDQNSALTLIRAERLRLKDWPLWFRQSVDPEDPDRDLAFVRKVEETLERDWPPNVRYPVDVFRVLRNEVCRGHACLEEARSIRTQSWGRGPIRYASGGLATPIPNVDRANSFCTWFLYEAQVRAEEGDFPAALASCECAIQCGRSLGDEPFLISQLNRLRISASTALALERILGMGEPAVHDLAELQRMFEEELADKQMLIGARGERAMVEELMLGLDKGDINLSQVRRMTGQGGSATFEVADFNYWLLSGDPNLNRAWLLRLSNRLVEIAELPIEEQLPASEALAEETEQAPRFVKDVSISHRRRSRSLARNITVIRCGIAACALERYRQERGDWPERLEVLVPDYLANVPLDPMSGRPLAYVRTGDGVLIYSVGLDRCDDGGKVNSTRNYVMNESKGQDCGLRIFSVHLRRQVK